MSIISFRSKLTRMKRSGVTWTEKILQNLRPSAANLISLLKKHCLHYSELKLNNRREIRDEASADQRVFTCPVTRFTRHHWKLGFLYRSGGHVTYLHGWEETEADRDVRRLDWLFHRLHRSDYSSLDSDAAIISLSDSGWLLCMKRWLECVHPHQNECSGALSSLQLDPAVAVPGPYGGVRP